MSRPLRIEYPNAWHHVMNRARRHQELFIDRDDYICFVELLKQTSELFNIRVSAYCFMPNHYHLLVQTPAKNLARCMRHLNGVYTQKYNVRYASDGTLFRGRYKSILVEEDEYLLHLVRYIHRNPLKAGIVKKMAHYPWSSHMGYVSNAKKWDWLHKRFILSMLSSNKDQQKRRYKLFVSQEDTEEIRQVFENKYLPSMLGSESFIEKLKKTFFLEKQDKEIPESKTLAPDSNRIFEGICEYYKIEGSKLYTVRRGTENEPRNVAIYLMRKLRADPLIKIGSMFNLSKHSSVGSVIERTEIKRQKDKKFNERVNQLTELLIKGQEET